MKIPNNLARDLASLARNLPEALTAEDFKTTPALGLIILLCSEIASRSVKLGTEGHENDI